MHTFIHPSLIARNRFARDRQKFIICLFLKTIEFDPWWFWYLFAEIQKFPIFPIRYFGFIEPRVNRWSDKLDARVRAVSVIRAWPIRTSLWLGRLLLRWVISREFAVKDGVEVWFKADDTRVEYRSPRLTLRIANKKALRLPFGVSRISKLELSVQDSTLILYIWY